MNHNSPRHMSQRRRKRDICGKNFLKVVLYVFIFFFWLTGIVFLALGLYIKLQKHTYISLLGSSTFPLATYLLLGTGAFIILTGIIGCTGTCIENRCFMVMYALFLLIIFLSEAIAGVLAYMYEGTIKEELSRNLNSTMMNNYNYDLIITKAIDDMQKEFACCGATEFENWEHSKWLQENPLKKGLVPDSCCISVNPGCASFGTSPSNIYPEGCSKALEKNTKNSLILIGGVGLGLCCIQLLGIIFSCCLVRKFRGRKESYWCTESIELFNKIKIESLFTIYSIVILTKELILARDLQNTESLYIFYIVWQLYEVYHGKIMICFVFLFTGGWMYVTMLFPPVAKTLSKVFESLTTSYWTMDTPLFSGH